MTTWDNVPSKSVRIADPARSRAERDERLGQGCDGVQGVVPAAESSPMTTMTDAPCAPGGRLAALVLEVTAERGRPSAVATATASPWAPATE